MHVSFHSRLVKQIRERSLRMLGQGLHSPHFHWSFERKWDSVVRGTLEFREMSVIDMWEVA